VQKGLMHMDKQSIVRRFERETDGQAFITATQLAKLLGRKDSYKIKEKYLANLECIDNKLYFIPDVAQEIMRHIS